MKSPFTGGEVRLKKDVRTLEYRKEKFEVVYHYYVCNDTGEQFTTDEVDTLNVNQVLNKYRAKYGIPSVEEIKLIRSKYGLSAAKMSEVLGLGPNVYRKYESGEMPSISTGRYIRLTEDVSEFLKLLSIAKNVFDQQEFDRILKKVSPSHQQSSGCNVDELDIWLTNRKLPNIFNGFRVPNLERIGMMVRFFASKLTPFTTALNKLMFYADFGHYRKYGTSISGLTYKAIQRGPVPANYGGIYDLVVNYGYADRAEVDFGDFVGDKFFYDKKVVLDSQDGPLTQTELNTLEHIAGNLEKLSTRQIVDLSHEEAGWQENINSHNEISYEYSFELKHID